MPGLFGFAGKLDPDHAHRLIQEMAKAMKDYDWYQVDSHLGDDFGLGRSSLGLSNPELQPIWNEDKTLCIVMEGELYDCQAMKQELIAKGHHFIVNNDAEFMLHLFEEYGKDFAIRLNGAFVAAIWNRHEKELVLVNDRLGLRPLYYASYNGRLTFASGVRALLADPTLPRHIDPVAIAQTLTFEHMLGNRTYLGEVYLLPPASTLVFRDNRYVVQSYWKLQFSEIYKFRKREEYLDDLIFYLRQAIKRQLPKDLLAGLNLSGGLDSRMLLGLLCNSDAIGSLCTFTFGIPYCDDVRIAQELADIAGTQHHFFELRPEYLIDVSTKGVMLTDGLMSCCHIHALANAEAQHKKVNIIYGGYLIDSLISSDLHREWLANYDDDTTCNFLYESATFLFRQKNKKDLFVGDFQQQVNQAFADSFRTAALDAKAGSFADWHNRFEIYQRARRFAENGNELLRGELICRTPFCDNDLVEYSLSVPPGLRLDRFIFIEAIARLFPKLAKVPWDKTGFPLVPCGRELFLRIDQKARWQLRKYGFKQFSDRQHRGYADYDTWMRTALRGWVEETLLSNRALERGYFNPSYIRQLVSSHMAGENHSRELGMLLSIELWHRQFID